MGICVGDLAPRQLERMRTELAETLAAHFAYPPFFDFAAGVAKTRPVEREKREEVARYLSSVNFDALARADVRSPEVRRFVERLLLRYIEVNPLLARPWLARRLDEMRARVPRLAAGVQRGLIELSEGGAPSFGARRAAASWSGEPRRAAPLPEEEQEYQTGVLQATLARSHQASAAASRPGGASGGHAGLSARASHGAAAPHSTIEHTPTRPLPAAAAGQGNGHQDRNAPREVPSDLYELYGDYLTDVHAAVSPAGVVSQGTPIGNGAWQAASMPVPAPFAPAVPSAPPQGSRQDETIFAQLRYQVEAYVRRAARGYGLPTREGDPAPIMDALRRSGMVDEADLRIAEGILALSDRVARQGHASIEDYRQAFTLYLLYHRSHLGA